MADVGDFEASLEKALSSLKERGFKYALKEAQIKCLQQLYLGKDLVAVLPTGFGKSLIFQLLVLMANQKEQFVRVGGEIATVLVISPLTSIIQDQILEVSSMGLAACSLVDQLHDLRSVLNGKFAIVYASPEAATDTGFLKSLKQSTFVDNLVACVIDETHTVATWTGLRSKKSNTKGKQETAFRGAFGELAVLRSFFPGKPFAALTGTADGDTVSTITDSLLMQDPLVIKISPNRENVRFCIVKGKKESLLQELDWFVNCVVKNGESTPKTIIFCNTMNDIACVTNYLMSKLGKAAYFPHDSRNASNCLLAIYQSCSWEHNKAKVVNSFKGDGKVRIVIASTALSMGVNFPDVRYIINWGPARDLLDQHQEIGRAGRDGVLSHSLILYHGQQLSQCEQAVKDFVKADGCIRVAAYKLLDPLIEPVKPLHNCCSVCSFVCKCNGSSCDAEKLPFEAISAETVNPSSNLTRPVVEEDRQDLREALKEIGGRMTGRGSVLVDRVSCHGFSVQLIDDIVKNCTTIFTVADILDSCPVLSLEHAIMILEVIQEIFLDIPNYDEAMDILWQGNLSSVDHSNNCLKDALESVELTDDVSIGSDDSDLDDPGCLC